MVFGDGVGAGVEKGSGLLNGESETIEIVGERDGLALVVRIGLFGRCPEL